MREISDDELDAGGVVGGGMFTTSLIGLLPLLFDIFKWWRTPTAR